MNLVTTNSLIVFTLVTLSCGLVGGWGGYLIERINLLQAKASTEITAEEISLYRNLSLALGVIAAFTVPAFLEVVSIGSQSESLVDQILDKNAQKALVVYAGFCLVAAVSGQSFISKLSAKIIDDLKDEAATARRDAKKAQQKSKETEQEVEELAEDIAFLQDGNELSQVSSNSIKVLNALESSDKYRLNFNDLNQTVNLDNDALENALIELQNAYMVSGKFVDDKRTWRTRSAGRIALKNEK